MHLFPCRLPVAGGLRLFAPLCAAVFAVATANGTLTVTNGADSGAGSLRQALADVHDGDTIRFDPALNGQTIGLTSAELAIDKNITITGPGPDLLTVARTSGVFRIFHLLPNHTATIQGLTVTNGLAFNGGGLLNDHATLTIVNCIVRSNGASTGGGILNDHATLTIDNCVVTGNGTGFGGGAGGGILNLGEKGSATLTILNCTISNNASGDGAGIYNDGATLSVTNSTVSNNVAYIFTGSSPAGDAGGIYNSGTLVIAHSTISDNMATLNGGGIVSDGALTITDSTITGNYAGHEVGAGGGIANGGSLTITNCTLSSNQAPGARDGNWGYGGAISNGGTVEIINSTLSGNGASSSGGAVDSYGSSATLTIVNSTLSGNAASYFSPAGTRGGAIASNGTLKITNSTLHGNSADTGGGVYNYATFQLGNTILDANNGINIFNDSGTVTSYGYNLSSDDGGGFLTATGDQINTNPMLGPLQDNGGPSFTHALLTGSTATNAGDPTFTPPPFTDQRGYLRVYNGRLDIGSFEMQPIGATRVVISADDSGKGSLRDTIAAAQAGDTIQFAAALNGQTITLTSGELAIDKSLMIAGPGASQLMVQRSTMVGTPAFRIFEIMPGRAVTIQGLTVSNGYAPDGNPSEPGGGIYNQGTLTMTDCILIGNRAAEEGGGIYNRYYGAVLTMTNCTVTANLAGNGGLGGYGGGIFNGGVLTATNCTFSGNTTIGGANGGGIYNAGTSTVSNSTVSANVGSYGGGIYNDGGITTMEVTNCTISGNTAYSRGGGLYNGDGTLILAHNTIGGNSANSSGGGIYNAGSPFHVTLEIGHNIFSGGGKGANIVNAAGTVTSHGYNLSTDNGGGYLTAAGDQINTDPLLGPLQDNGGPTFTHQLLAGSPAIDTGNPSFIPPPSIDQRGYLRVYNGRIDIGSVEVQPIPTPSPTPTPSFTPARLLNISTRLQVGADDGVAIAGFIITPATDSAPKSPSKGGGGSHLIKGIGPSLRNFGVPDPLSDPTLELRNGSGGLIYHNDNWQDDPLQRAQIKAFGDPHLDGRESAIIWTLQPGAYTAILAGKNGGTGVGLVEVYDVSYLPPSQLANISTRGFVGTGSNVMIGGFILGGSTDTQVALRGIGPSLADFGLAPVLADPTLELHDGNGATLISNDNWQDDPVQAAQLSAHGLAPSNPDESGIIASLPPDAYTAILAGKNGGTGIGLVEIYNLQ